MRKRGIRIQVWLNQDENARLRCNAKTSGVSQESYLRSLINGYVPKALPPADYFDMIRELHAIGSNINQLAAKANTTGYVDKAAFENEAAHLRKALCDIQAAVTSPERRHGVG
jgi:hypothetical protein